MIMSDLFDFLSGIWDTLQLRKLYNLKLCCLIYTHPRSNEFCGTVMAAIRKQCKAAIYSNIKLTRISNVWYSNCWLTKLLWILWNNKSISRVRHWIQKNITFYLWHCWEILFYLSTQRRYISSVVETIKLGTF